MTPDVAVGEHCWYIPCPSQLCILLPLPCASLSCQPSSAWSHGLSSSSPVALGKAVLGSQPGQAAAHEPHLHRWSLSRLRAVPKAP